MRVAQISEFGGLEALRLEEAAEPAPGPGEVLIKVTAAGLNFSDTLILRNKYQVTPPLPFSPGSEIAGSIEGVGAGVTGFQSGAEGRGRNRRQWLPRESSHQGEQRGSPFRTA